MDNFHLRKQGKSWHLNREGVNQPFFTFPSKGMAFAQCGESFQGRIVCLKVHGEDGSIEEVRTYPRSFTELAIAN